jgi:hypothetical protein
VSDNVIDEPNEFMTMDNGYWVLANYDMFKGARPGTVEVHGGATLEEVVIPIIEITKNPENLHIDVITKIVEAGYKKKQILKFVSNYPINNISVRINAKTYLAVSTDGLHFDAEIPDIKREKEYLFDVLSNNNILQRDLKFRLKTAGMSENDLL